jgi:glycosyltransferase involved in cell wall biosynthesis
MKLTYVTTYDATDIHNWSGLGQNIAKSLESQGAEVDYVGNLHHRTNALLKLKSKIYNRIGKTFSLEREPYVAKQYAKQAKSFIKDSSDVIFSPGSIPIAFLDSIKPKVFYTDATFAGMIGFYKEFSNLSAETIRHGNYLEQKAIETSQMVLFASEWAAKTAVENYKVDINKIKVIPFGANITHNLNYKDIIDIVNKRAKDECNLLFLGVEWERKRASLAIKVTEELNRLGLKATLHIAGLKDIPISYNKDYVVNHGFISKSNEGGQAKLNNLIASSHFLIVPSKAEAYGLVYCFGVPAIATDVGGIPTIIKDGINGKTFSLSATEHEYAEYIFKVFSDYYGYQQLALSSFKQYESRLNWDVAGRSIIKLLEEVV